MSLIIKFLVYALIFTFPLGFLARITPVPNVHIIPQDIVMFFLFIILFYNYSVNKISNEFKYFVLFQGLFVGVGVVMLIANSFIHRDINIPISFLYAARYLMYLSLLFIGPFFQDSKRIVHAIFGSLSIFLFLGFIQYVKFNDLKPLFNLGWDDHLYRMFSTVLDPNYAGVIFVIYFLLLSHFVYFHNFNKSFMHLVLSFFTMLAVYLTYSRTALLGLITGVAAVLVSLRKFKILLFSAILFSVMLFAVSDVSVEGLNPFRTASSVNRLVSMREATQIIMESKFLGVGFNAYRYAQIRNGIRSEEGALKSNADAGTDNSFLYAMATTGVLGFSFFALSYFVLLRKLLKEANSVFFVGILLSLLVSSLFLNVLFYTPILTIAFLVFALRKKFI